MILIFPYLLHLHIMNFCVEETFLHFRILDIDRDGS